jgi:hypothetical protein
VTIDYELYDEQSDPAMRIVLEYSLPGGGGWLPATEGPGGDGVTDLAASPSGTPHSFSWDAAADGACSEGVVFRIGVEWQAPDHSGEPLQRPRMAATTPPFRLACTTWYRDADADGQGNPTTTIQGWTQPAGYLATGDDCGDANPDCTSDCTDADADGLCVPHDCNDAVPSVGTTAFGQTITAQDTNTLIWTTPADVRWRKGNLAGLSGYVTAGAGSLYAATSLDISADSPGSGAGMYYVVRELGCGSWQTELGTEPGRDADLPLP